MKLIIVTPVSSSSAIARSTSLVVNSLRNIGHTINTIRSESDKRLHETPLHFAIDASSWSETPRVKKLLTDADLIIYQIGDNYEYHAGCLHLMAKYPGLVVLHDIFVADLFLAYFQNDSTYQLNKQLDKWYGNETTSRFFSALENHGFYDFASQHAPMTECIAHKALGIISHSLLGMERILNSCSGPVACIPLAYDAPFTASTTKSMPKGNDRRILLTFGYLNPNKRARSIIHALGKSPLLKKRFIYRLVGAVNDVEKAALQTLADEYGVHIEFTGVVKNPEEFAQEIVNADIVSCLRYPVLEAFSASTIEAMLYGKIIMVNDVSFYKDFPNECVIKIPIESEINDIKICLNDFLKNEIKFENYGISAQKWAKQVFNADSYAKKLIKVAERVLVCNPINTAVQRISNDLKNWGVSKSSPILQATIEAIQPIFEDKQL